MRYEITLTGDDMGRLQALLLADLNAIYNGDVCYDDNAEEIALIADLQDRLDAAMNIESVIADRFAAANARRRAWQDKV